jgi:DegV family protein with EDD domain
MSKTAVVTDTDASLSLEVAKRHKIFQVPIIVQFGEEGLRDVFDVDDKKAFERINREGKLPTTSAPSPGAFSKAYQAAFDEGYDNILCFTVSAEVSATHQAALNAADLFPGKEITVVDTRSLTYAQGFMVLAAAKALEQGATKAEALAAAQNLDGRTHLYAALSTLKYLAMSGRVGHLTAGIASLLDVKPILTIRNGKLDMLERVRTQNRAWGRVIELSVAAAAGKVIEQAAFIHVNALEDAKALEKSLRGYLPLPDEVIFSEMNPGLSIHSGEGMAGIVLVTGREH